MSRRRTPPPGTFAFISLGCPKNLIDAERTLARLTAAGLVLTDEPSQAEAVVINTCGFIREAIEESSDVIEQALALRGKGRCRRVVVAGCLSQRFRPEEMELLGRADALFGILDGPTAEALTRYLVTALAPGASPARMAPTTGAPWDPFTRLRLTRRHYAYLRVAEGCANRCRYCVIPDIRGPLRSRPLEEVVAEAEHLVADGAVELCLVAEDTTSYGRDRGEADALAGLLRELADIEGLRWIRLLYTHPAHFSDELIEALVALPKVCRYVDLPIQHADDGVLAAMGRGVTCEGIRRLIGQLRGALPGLFLRTSIIVGFPGEGEEEFGRLLEFLKEVCFERLGVFAYSPEPGTPACELAGQVLEEERERRRDAVMTLQQEIAFRFNAGLLGRRLAAIVDEAPGEGASHGLGRTYGDAPEVDGVLYLSGPQLAPGELWEARIVGTQGYDLVGLAERRMEAQADPGCPRL